jgi:hypothetical protein
MTDQVEGQAPQAQEEHRRQLEQLVQGALLGPTQKFYVNGFAFAQTGSDVSLVIMLHNQPTAAITMSYVTAKSILVDLTQILAKYEEATEQQIKTFAELNQLMARLTGQPDQQTNR